MTTAPLRIDAHLHLWDLELGEYSWLGPDSGDLYASFRAEDAAPGLARAGVDGAVLVQAEDSLADTEYLLAVASRHPWVLAVVGWVQLDDPDAAATQLDDVSSHPALRGIRHLVHDDPRDDFLELPPVRRSLRDIAARGLAFDVPDSWPRHLPGIPSLADDLPELTIVIDHLGKPPRDPGERAAWHSALTDAAARPNTVAKLSGLTSSVPEYTAGGLEELWTTALDAFGPSRLLWGSDWPVSGRGYDEIVDPLFALVSTLSADEQRAVLGGTAEHVYNIPEVAR